MSSYICTLRHTQKWHSFRGKRRHPRKRPEHRANCRPFPALHGRALWVCRALFANLIRGVHLLAVSPGALVTDEVVNRAENSLFRGSGRWAARPRLAVRPRHDAVVERDALDVESGAIVATLGPCRATSRQSAVPCQKSTLRTKRARCSRFAPLRPATLSTCVAGPRARRVTCRCHESSCPLQERARSRGAFPSIVKQVSRPPSLGVAAAALRTACTRVGAVCWLRQRCLEPAPSCAQPAAFGRSGGVCATARFPCADQHARSAMGAALACCVRGALRRRLQHSCGPAWAARASLRCLWFVLFTTHVDSQHLSALPGCLTCMCTCSRFERCSAVSF